MLQGASKAGEDIRQPGSDIKAGQAVLQAGDLLGAAEIGLLATVGAAQVKVSLETQSCLHGHVWQSTAHVYAYQVQCNAVQQACCSARLSTHCLRCVCAQSTTASVCISHD